VLSHPVTQRPLQPWSKRAWLLLRFAADLGIILVMLVLQTCSMQELQGSQRLPPRFQKKAWKARQCATELRSLPIALEREMCEAVWVKPKLQ
jgi:hypothetical protein